MAVQAGAQRLSQQVGGAVRRLMAEGCAESHEGARARG